MLSESMAPGVFPRNYLKRNLHHATFFCVAPKAQHVALIGDFNDWQPAPMRRMPDGQWIATLELPHGCHQYLFLVDDQPVLDPNASGQARNGRNELVSLIAIS